MEAPRQRLVASVVNTRGCFGFRSRHPPTVEVLTDATAAGRVRQDGVPVVLWLDLAASTFFLTQRWGYEVVKQQVPVNVAVTALPSPTPTTYAEAVVATVSFRDKASLEAFAKLAMQVLPDWLAIRQGALGKNMLLSGGHWLLDYHATALRVRWAGGGASGLLQLDLHMPCITLQVLQQGSGLGEAKAVTSLAEAVKLISRQSRTGAQVMRSVQQSVLTLKPTPASVTQLKLKLQAAAQCQKRALSMSAWLNGGILAALVDAAACLPVAAASAGHEEQADTQLSVLQGLSECACCVLVNAGTQAVQQAELLVACISRSLFGHSRQLPAVVQLLQLILQQSLDECGQLWRPLLQACQDPGLLQALLDTYGASLQQLDAARQQAESEDKAHDLIHDLFYKHQPVQLGGPHSHPVLFEPSEPADPGSNSMPFAETGGQPARQSVPRLSLPAAGSSTPPADRRSSRLPRLADASPNASLAGEASQGSGQAHMASLQLLGHGCGESMVAAELAAFATYKHSHAGDLARQHAHLRPLQEAPGAEQLVEQPLPSQQLQFLPPVLRLQLQLLECLQCLVEQLPAGSGLPLPLSSLLLRQLLLPRSILMFQLQQTQAHQPQAAAVDSEVALLAFDRQRHLATKLVAGCSAARWQQRHACSSAAADDTRDAGPRLHDTVMAQLKQRLLDYCTIRRPDASVHLACREALLLLRDYLRMAGQTLLADTACNMVGRALAQQEHLLRSARVTLWSWPAVLHMDALVQLYAELAQRVGSPAAVDYLMGVLGCLPASPTPRSRLSGVCSSSSGGGSDSSRAGPGEPVAAYTLQLVLDFLQQRLGGSAARVSSSRQDTSNRRDGDCCSGAAQGVSQQQQQAGEQDAAQNTAGIKAHCWQLLTAVLQLAARQAQRASHGGVRLSTACSSDVTEQPSLANSSCLSLTVAPSSSSSGGGSSRMTGRAAGASAAASLQRLLVELLVRQRGGRAFVLQQLEELDGSPSALPLQQQLLGFLCAVLADPESYAARVPGLVEFYVHHHWVAFVRHYYKLPSAPGPSRLAEAAKGHLEVLLALCHHAGGAQLVRRRFTQLKVLEFLARELSLEHSLCSQQHQACSSCCSTPLSTARRSSSGRQLGSARGLQAGAKASPGAVPPAVGGISRLACESHAIAVAPEAEADAEVTSPHAAASGSASQLAAPDSSRSLKLPLHPRPPEVPRPADTRDALLQQGPRGRGPVPAAEPLQPLRLTLCGGSSSSTPRQAGAEPHGADDDAQRRLLVRPPAARGSAHSVCDAAAAGTADRGDPGRSSGRWLPAPLLPGDGDECVQQQKTSLACEEPPAAGRARPDCEEADTQAADARDTGPTPPAAAPPCLPRPVPRLFFGAARPPAADVAAAASPGSCISSPLSGSPLSGRSEFSCSSEGESPGGYRPGLDLEDDLERLLLDEQEGGTGAWSASDDAASQCSHGSSLIAAGRAEPDVCEEEGQQQHSPPRSERRASDSGSLRDSGSDSGSEFAEEPFSDAADRAGQASDEAGEAHRSLPRLGVVPQLRLPTPTQPSPLPLPALDLDQQQPGYAASSASSLSPGVRPAVPTLMSVVTPLTTSRMRPCSHRGAELLPAGNPGSAAGSRLHLGLQQLPLSEDASLACGHDLPGLDSYRAHRHGRALYCDGQLQVLCLELALHLLVTPAGVLDPLLLPQDPTDCSLQHTVVVLLDHLSHADNSAVISQLAGRTGLLGGQQLRRRSTDGGRGAAGRQSASGPAEGLGRATLQLLKLLSGHMCPPLQLSKLMQKGAFSEIHEARVLGGGDEGLAVKKLECDEADHSNFERVHNEVAILERLQGCQGVIQLLDYGVRSTCSKPEWLLVFRRYDRSLKRWRSERGPGLQQRDVPLYLRIFVQVASIVCRLHASNVVHYDIKGDNLLLADRPTPSAAAGSTLQQQHAGDKGSAQLPFDIVLADFGDALLVEGDGAAAAQRHRGTELFSSPEMLLLHAGRQHPGHEAHDRRRHRGVGRAHDIWSLGCTLFELMTGSLLFEEEGVGRITSLGSCSGGGGSGQQARPGCGGVLSRAECALLGGCAGVVELVECMLVGDPAWRPTAPEVVFKAQRLLDACSSRAV